MSDQRLRDLERRWREGGSVEDEAAYLRERVRVGDLTHERLELAAYCGRAAAELCVDLPGLKRRASAHGESVLAELKEREGLGPFDSARTPLGSWLLGASLWGAGYAAAGAIACARLILPRWTAEFPEDPRPSLALMAAARSLGSEDESLRREAGMAASRCAEAGQDRRRGGNLELACVAWAASQAASAVAGRARAPGRSAIAATGAVAMALSRGLLSEAEARETLRHAITEEALATRLLT